MRRALVNITIVTHNRLALTRRTIESVLRHTRERVALCVVDNASQDGTQDYLRGLMDAGSIDHLVLFARNVGVACACNAGWHAAEADYYLKLDNDMELLHDGWLRNLLQFFQPGLNAGCVAYKVIPDDASPLLRIGPTAVYEAEFCGGACLLTSREVRRELGNFCEDYGVYGEEDADFGIRCGLSGRRNFLLDGHGHVEHLSDAGYDERMRPVKARQARRRGIEQFQQNIHAYDTGLRPLHVGRRFLPVRQGDLHTLALNPEYKREAMDFNRYRKVVAFATRHIVEGHLDRQHRS